MAIKLYDLAGAEPDRRFSPYCWRTRMALAHKGLEVETIPWRFTEKDAIAFSGQGRVPVLIDGARRFQTPGRSPGTLSKRIRIGLHCSVAPRAMPSPALSTAGPMRLCFRGLRV